MKKVSLILIILCLTTILHAQLGTGLQFKFRYQSKNKKVSVSSFGFSGILPESYSLKNYTPFVKNQGNYGTCVSWSMVYCAITTQYAIKMKLPNRNVITSMAFCPYFTHNNSKETTDGCSSGSFFDDAAFELTEIGAKKFYLPIIGCATPNDDKMLIGARNYRMDNVSDIYNYTDDVSDDYTTYMKNFIKKIPFKVDDVKQAIASDKVVVLGMYLPPSFKQAYNTELWEPDSKEKQDPVGALLNAEGQLHALHAMAIVGYDNEKFGGAFEIQNSWGDAWGNKGYIWVKYADLQRYAFQLLIIDLPKVIYNGTTGCITGDCNNGYGIVKYTNGEIYEGFFKNGKYDGYGVYSWADGSTYAGEWKEGLRNGDAVRYFSDGSSGRAYYADDVFQSGFQKYEYEDGNSYQGEVEKGSFNGYGIYKFANGDWYEGVFANNVYDGLGKYQFSNGSFYIGYFTEGKKNGMGLFVGSDGKIWGGNWSYDQFKTGKKYGFANDKNFEPGNIPIGANKNYVDANCTSGDCLNGIGKRVYEGSTYEGEFKDGLEDGIGKTIYDNGTIAETFYSGGTAIGVCVLKYADGSILIGSLKNGSIDGYIVYFDVSGGTVIGTYTDGEYNGKLSSANTHDFTAGSMPDPENAGFKSVPTAKQ